MIRLGKEIPAFRQQADILRYKCDAQQQHRRIRQMDGQQRQRDSESQQQEMPAFIATRNDSLLPWKNSRVLNDPPIAP